MTLPPTLLRALESAMRAFEEQNLDPPTAMIVGEDIQLMLLVAGARPKDGTWGEIMGVEIRGVSDRIQGYLGHGFYTPLEDGSFQLKFHPGSGR